MPPGPRCCRTAGIATEGIDRNGAAQHRQGAHHDDAAHRLPGAEPRAGANDAGTRPQCVPYAAQQRCRAAFSRHP